MPWSAVRITAMVLGAGSAPPGRRTWSGQRKAAPPPTKAAFHAALQGARRVSSHKNGPKFHPNGWALKWPKRCQSHGSNLSLLRGSPHWVRHPRRRGWRRRGGRRSISANLEVVFDRFRPRVASLSKGSDLSHGIGTVLAI